VLLDGSYTLVSRQDRDTFHRHTRKSGTPQVHEYQQVRSEYIASRVVAGLRRGPERVPEDRAGKWEHRQSFLRHLDFGLAAF